MFGEAVKCLIGMYTEIYVQTLKKFEKTLLWLSDKSTV